MTGRKHDLPQHGLLVVDKPSGITSRDVVNRIQRHWPPRTRIGHTGTLDPLATGVLVICLGQATRLAEFIQDMPKTYRATIRLGASSTTDDADGEITEHPEAVPVDAAHLAGTLSRFIGEIEQVPPVYSAVKQGGRRAYEQARSGVRVELRPRRVRVDAIRVVRYAWPTLEVLIDCGKGTYIRSLARDLGQALGVGGMITALRRTRVGPFDESQAVPVAEFDSPRADMVRPLSEAVAELPAWQVTAEERRRLCQGQRITAAAPVGWCAVFHGGELQAIAQSDGRTIRPVKVLVADDNRRVDD